MATASPQIAQQLQDARREVKAVMAQARRANRALAIVQEELASLGIRLITMEEGDE